MRIIQKKNEYNYLIFNMKKMNKTFAWYNKSTGIYYVEILLIHSSAAYLHMFTLINNTKY